MLSRFIHVVAWVRISLLFKAECRCPEGAHLADPSPASGHLGCLRLLAPVDNAAGSVTVQMSHSRPYLLYSRIDTEVELRLVILHKISRGGATLSSTAAAPFHTPTEGARAPPPPHPPPHSPSAPPPAALLLSITLTTRPAVYMLIYPGCLPSTPNEESSLLGTGLSSPCPREPDHSPAQRKCSVKQ